MAANEGGDGLPPAGGESPVPSTGSNMNRKRQIDVVKDRGLEVDENSQSILDGAGGPHAPKHLRLDGRAPVASSMDEFVKNPSCRPRNEWLQMPNETSCERSEVEEKTDPLASTNVIFGVDKDTALHFCIRNHHHEAAERLIDAGAPVDLENAKGVTPLILAAQTGNLKMIRLLESRGAFESHVTLSGSTAVLQAAHFGHLSVVQHLLRKNHQLLEQANYHHTTPLMRASQEGHLQIVQFLCDMGATVNRKNLQAMTALMLASQRGNAKICRYLIQRGADLDAMTGHTSTSLVLACKRQHLDTVKVLVTAGAELFLKDNRGRTARDIALQRRPFTRNRDDATTAILTLLLDPTVQVDLMRKQARRDRSWSWMRLLALIQQDRARLRSAEDVPLHEAIDLIEERRSPPKSTTAWIRTLSLPTPLVQHIAQFAPLPTMWDRRLSLLTGRCVAAPNAALESIFDLMDEVLEESNFLTALDEALVLPPVNFASWVSLACVFFLRNNIFQSLMISSSLHTIVFFDSIVEGVERMVSSKWY